MLKKTVSTVKRRILVVDDEYINRMMLANILLRMENCEVLEAENGAEALRIIREHRADLSLVMLDLIMPVMNGFELLETLQQDEALRQLPVIVLTSEKSYEVKSLALGAMDFIPKPYDLPEIILARVRRIIELYEDRGVLRGAERDELTGLLTREIFLQYARVYDTSSEERMLDAVACNIDHFHLINELYGREFGDEVLKRVADSIKAFLTETSGLGCRSEADMFYLYCEHHEDYGELLAALNRSLRDLDSSRRIRLRIGVYSRERDESLTMEQILDRAQLACNTIREDYGASIANYDGKLHDEEIFLAHLVSGIHSALEHHEIKVVFQPKYDIRGEEPVLVSAEALIRWHHPEHGMISPGVFVPLFENNGLIEMVDLYTWREVARQIREWKDTIGYAVPVSINVSRIDIYDPEIEEKIAAILRENQLTPDDILLEITESAYAEDPAQLIEVIDHLRAKGFRVEMDDFGSGYSSIGMLSTIQIDALKLDAQFVRGMEDGPKGARLVELILDVADYLEVPVVAEGVETMEQCAKLRAIGCDIVQGYCFSRPIGPESFGKLLAAAR